MAEDRKRRILNILIENYSNRELTISSRLAAELGISTKTVQKEIAALNMDMSDYGIRIETVSGKGYHLIVKEEKRLKEFLQKAAEEAQIVEESTNEMQRAYRIIAILILRNRVILSDEIANELHISRSRLSGDLKIVKEILMRYSLEVSARKKQGICVSGSEQDRRMCLIREKINCASYIKESRLAIGQERISDIVVEELSAKKYRISDRALEQLIVYLELTLARISRCCRIEEIEEDIALETWVEYAIAEEIMQKLQKKGNLEIGRRETEYLAIFIHSHKIYRESDFVAEEIGSFLQNGLELLKSHYGIDLTGDISLRTRLSAHLVPMIVRAKNHMLLTNDLQESIRRSMPIPFEMAVFLSDLIQKRFNICLNDDEKGYLALHFYVSLETVRKNDSGIQVLILTSYRNCESLMLKYNFQRHFGEQIQNVDILQTESAVIWDMEKYNIFLTTTELHEEILERLPVEPVRISYYLNREDCEKIEALICGSNRKERLQEYFRKELFLLEDHPSDKEELLKRMCQCLERLHPQKEDLYAAVLKREQMGSTAFGEILALPHPDHIFADQTDVVTACLKNPVDWDGRQVRLVFLINVAAGQNEDMEGIYDFIAWLIQDHGRPRSFLGKSTHDALKLLIEQYRNSRKERGTV